MTGRTKLGLIFVLLITTVAGCAGSKNIVVDGKQWESYAEWEENYIGISCKPSTTGDGTNTCLPVTKSRTVCSGSSSGTGNQVVYPELSCRGDNYFQSAEYIIVFHTEDSGKSGTGTAVTSEENWRSAIIGKSYIVEFDLFGNITRME